jgi:hypothetical protein
MRCCGETSRSCASFVLAERFWKRWADVLHVCPSVWLAGMADSVSCIDIFSRTCHVTTNTRPWFSCTFPGKFLTSWSSLPVDTEPSGYFLTSNSGAGDFALCIGTPESKPDVSIYQFPPFLPLWAWPNSSATQKFDLLLLSFHIRHGSL